MMDGLLPGQLTFLPPREMDWLVSTIPTMARIGSASSRPPKRHGRHGTGTGRAGSNTSTYWEVYEQNRNSRVLSRSRRWYSSISWWQWLPMVNGYWFRDSGAAAPGLRRISQHQEHQDNLEAGYCLLWLSEWRNRRRNTDRHVLWGQRNGRADREYSLRARVP